MSNLIQIIGWRTKQPQLVSGPTSFDDLEGQTIYWFENITPDTETEYIALPLWSGRIQAELTIIYDAPPTVPAVGYVTPSFAPFGAARVTPTPDFEDALEYRGIVDFVGGRFTRYFHLYTGSGYGSATAYWSITTYGCEET